MNLSHDLQGLKKKAKETFLYVLSALLLEHQCKEHGHGEQEHQRGQVQLQGVADIQHQVGVFQQPLEILEAHKFGSLKALEQLVIVKRAAQEPHGHVFQQQKIDHHRQDHQIDVPIAIDSKSHQLPLPAGIENGLPGRLDAALFRHAQCEPSLSNYEILLPFAKKEKYICRFPVGKVDGFCRLRLSISLL